MDAITHVVAMWANEGLIVIGTLMAVGLFHYATRLWSAPLDAVLGIILGATIGVVGSLLFIYRHFWGIHIGVRASWFIVLYFWCVVCMVFLASRDTSRTKLFMGLVSQAGILYALFVFL